MSPGDTSLDSARAQIEQLVARFHDNISSYKNPAYKEAQARVDFINPLFDALGWDVYNKAGYAEAYRDVIHEDAIKVGGLTKAPDYCFRIGGQRKFFVEAKKPFVSIKFDPEPYYQLRRYAYSAKLPLSILTDFEELAIVDCRDKPSKHDKPSTGRIRYWRYEEYADNLEEIYSTFSKDAVLKGSFDRFAVSKKARRGTGEVDKEFLREIESWRDLLARNTALRNPSLTQRDLNAAVQLTIDRIIFLRICEDRGIEEYGVLQGLQNGVHVYARLTELFQRADDRYNSGLFHFSQERDRSGQPDELTLSLAIDDKPLKDILKALYYPDSPYEFSVLPIDILGQVYEQFLGKVIRLTAGHRAVVEEKPEVKKAGGVYYTPTYIVDYIVKNTVGRSVESKSPKQIAKLRILDPACGSGSFLIGAYEYLLDWHRDWYIADGSEKWASKKNLCLFQGRNGWQLTTAEKKRILLNNIHGVDIDPQAVEVTKLSLLLKVLEEENAETIGKNLSLFHERALPDLSNNIKCGNSLIGDEFYDGQQMGLLGQDELYRVNPFNWQNQFPEIMQGGGFDVIIGNPPYVRIQALKEWAPLEVEFYKNRYASAEKGNYDIYVVFVERGLGLLNKNGLLGFILPHKFFNAKYGESLRELIAKGKHLSRVVHFGHQQVFEGAATYTCLMFLDKAGTDHLEFSRTSDLISWQNSNESDEGSIPSEKITKDAWNFVVGPAAHLFEKLDAVPVKLADVAARLAQGIRTSANEVYVLDIISELDDARVLAHSKLLDREVILDRNSISPFLQGREIKPFSILPSGKIVIIPYVTENGRARFLTEKEMRETSPNTFSYLFDNKAYLENRERGRMKGENWFAYVYPKNIEIMGQSKILVPDIAEKASFALDGGGSYAFTSGYGITLKSSVSESMEYFLGLLNSSVTDFFIKNVSTTIRGGYFRYFTQFIEQIPIPSIDFSVAADKNRHDKMVELVNQMLVSNKNLLLAKDSQDKIFLQRQIDATSRQIDLLAFELYGLTNDEIKVLQEAL